MPSIEGSARREQLYINSVNTEASNTAAAIKSGKLDKALKAVGRGTEDAARAMGASVEGMIARGPQIEDGLRDTFEAIKSLPGTLKSVAEANCGKGQCTAKSGEGF